MPETALTTAERDTYREPPCPVCGGPTEVGFVSVLSHDQDPSDPDTPQWVAATITCVGDCVRIRELPLEPSGPAPASIKVCPLDGEPVVFTLKHPGAEYLCVICGWLGGIFGPGEVEATADLIARRDVLVARYEQSLGLRPPEQDRPHPSCTGCDVTATGRLDHSGKPAHWYSRTVDGVTEYACSRGCIKSGSVLPW